jgi:hypothetical protein
MKFIDFLNEHQKIMGQLLAGKLDLDRMKNLRGCLDVAIDAYAECTDEFLRASKRWNDKTKQLCELRDLLTKELGKTERHEHKTIGI